MARKPRIHYPGAIYHVMLRGNAKQVIFHKDEESCSYGAAGQGQTAFEIDAKYRSALYTLVQ